MQKKIKINWQISHWEIFCTKFNQEKTTKKNIWNVSSVSKKNLRLNRETLVLIINVRITRRYFSAINKISSFVTKDLHHWIFWIPYLVKPVNEFYCCIFPGLRKKLEENMSQHLTHHSFLSSKHVVVQKCYLTFLCTWAMSCLYHGFQCLFPFSISRNVQLSCFQNGLWLQHFPRCNKLYRIGQNWLILIFYLKKCIEDRVNVMKNARKRYL